MNQNSIKQSLDYWQAKSQSYFQNVPLFKMKLHKSQQQNPNSKETLFFHLPRVKKIVQFSLDVKDLINTYKFNNDTHSFEFINVQNNKNQIINYIVSGSLKGQIQCLPIKQKYHNNQNQQNQQQNNYFILKNSLPKQNYINDILNLGNNKIVNCYNNGTIAFWDLKQRKKIFDIQNLHSNFTYKLRKVQNRLISCGHDHQIVVTDLIKLKKVQNFTNRDSTWCAYPLNFNLISSAGLFNRINIWDIRTKNIALTTNLQNFQTSFITSFGQNNIVFGDGRILKKCDLRKMICTGFAPVNMQHSAQTMIVTSQGGYACGRGAQLTHFQAVSVINNQNKSKIKRQYAFLQGDLFLNPINQNIQLQEQLINFEQDQDQNELQLEDQLQGQLEQLIMYNNNIQMINDGMQIQRQSDRQSEKQIIENQQNQQNEFQDQSLSDQQIQEQQLQEMENQQNMEIDKQHQNEQIYDQNNKQQSQISQ